jgi:hypothetical protein
MIRSPAIRAGLVVLTMLLAGAVAGPAASAAPPTIQAVPTPLAFVSNLDLECYRTNTYVPPTTTILTAHLNPVLAGLPAETVQLGNRDKLCVPVAKNGVIPPPGVLEFVRYVDLSCYRIQGQPANRTLQLTHLNRVLQSMGVPPNVVTMTLPQHLCLPVIKNGVTPPAEVLNLVRFIDLKCYATTVTSLNIPLGLSHLNPVLANLPRHQAQVTAGRQLCVPVRKNNQAIPTDVLNIVRWIDLQMYDVVTAPLPAPVNLVLRHINPALGHLPQEQVSFNQAIQLGLPVAKNNAIPPG